MRLPLLIAALFSIGTWGMAQQAPSPETLAKAKKLADQFIITDGHVDLPFRLKVRRFQLDREYTGIPIQSADGDFDYRRAKAGGLDAPFMSIYIPASYDPAGGRQLADSLIRMVNWIAEQNPTYFEVARTPDDIVRIKKTGKLALPMGMENGSPITELGHVKAYREKGISYITLTHGKDNQLGDSSYDTTGTWKGLSPFGKEVVQEMMAVGVMIDISHVSDRTFHQVVDMSKVPVIASHSSARKFTPGFERNMADDMIRRMRQNKGVIMVNFGSTFVDGEVTKKRAEHQKKLIEFLKTKGITSAREEAAKPFIQEFNRIYPPIFADVQRVADHIDHIVALAGVDHVGFGSDYDGVGDSLPTGLKDVSDYPNLIAVLLQRGYSEKDIEKICGGNLLRVWREVLAFAAK